MASKISSLLIGMQFDGSQAEEGMASVAASADSMAESVKNASSVIESATADVFSKGLKTAKDFAASVIATGTAMATLALSAEGIQAKLGIVFDSAEKGMAVFDGLKEVSVQNSVGLDDLSDSAMKLANAGFSATRSLELVAKAAKLDILAGGGGRGVGQVTSALAELQTAGFATAGIFEKLKGAGINASSALADELSKTGKKFTPETAMDVLDRGGVLGATGKNAVEAALADPKALAAAEKLGDTVAGRVDRIQGMMREAVRSSGEVLVNALPIKEFTAMIEGGAKGVHEVIQELVRELNPLFGQSNDNSIQAAFEFGRTAAKDISFTLLDAGAGLVDSFGGVQKMMMTIEGNRGWWDPMTMVSGLWDKEGVAKRNALLDERDAMGNPGDILRERVAAMRAGSGNWDIAGGPGDFGGPWQALPPNNESAASYLEVSKAAQSAMTTDFDKFLSKLSTQMTALGQINGQSPEAMAARRDQNNLLEKTISEFTDKTATGAEKVAATFNQIEQDWAAVRKIGLDGARENSLLETFRRQRETAMAEYEESTLNSVQAFIRGQDALAKEMEAFKQIADPEAQGRMTAAALAKTQGALEAFEAGTLTPFEKYFAERGKIEKELDSAKNIADAAVRERVLEVLKRRDDATQEILTASTQTDYERLQAQMDKASAAFDQGVINADETAIDVAARQMGQLGLQVLNLGRIGDSFFAQRADRGSVEEYQARMRDRFGDQGRSLEDLLEAGNRQAKAQSDTQIEILNRIANKAPAIMPGKVVMGRN